MMKKNIPYLEEWLELANSGNFNKAQELYYENLFNAVIDNFKNNYKESSNGHSERTAFFKTEIPTEIHSRNNIANAQAPEKGRS